MKHLAKQLSQRSMESGPKIIMIAAHAAMHRYPYNKKYFFYYDS